MRNTLNPQAGATPMPCTTAELEAAELAGKISYRAYPYYLWRYGDRGRAFTSSDSAWLVYLSTQPTHQVKRHIEWLHGVLTNRGMPGLLLEKHLIVLARLLNRLVDPCGERSERLLAAADALKVKRTDQIDSFTSLRLAEEFSLKVCTKETRLLVATGELILAATADTLGGAPNAVPSLVDWLKDTKRLAEVSGLVDSLQGELESATREKAFSERWCYAIESTIEAAGLRRQRKAANRRA